MITMSHLSVLGPGHGGGDEEQEEREHGGEEVQGCRCWSTRAPEQVPPEQVEGWCSWRSFPCGGVAVVVWRWRRGVH